MSVMTFFSCLSNFPLSLSSSLRVEGEERKGEGWQQRRGENEKEKGEERRGANEGRKGGKRRGGVNENIYLVTNSGGEPPHSGGQNFCQKLQALVVTKYLYTPQESSQ